MPTEGHCHWTPAYRQHRPQQQHPQSTCITILQRQWRPTAQDTYSHTASSTVNTVLLSTAELRNYCMIKDNIIPGPYKGQNHLFYGNSIDHSCYTSVWWITTRKCYKTQCTIQCSLVIKHTNYFNILSLKTQWACLHAHHKISVLKKMLTCSTTIGIFLCIKHIPNSFSFPGIIEKLLPIIMLHLRMFG